MILASSILPVASTRTSSPQLGQVTIERSVLLVLFTNSATNPKSSIPRALSLGWNRDGDLGPARAFSSVVDEAEQFGSLAIGQVGQGFRVSDPTLGQDPAGLDRADLRERQEGIPHPPVLR